MGRQENSSWALLEVTKVFCWGARRLSKSSRVTIFRDPERACVRSWISMLRLERCLAPELRPGSPLRTLKIKVFVWTVCEFRDFRIFNTNRQKEHQNEPQGLPKWSPKSIKNWSCCVFGVALGFLTSKMTSRAQFSIDFRTREPSF